MYEGAFLNSSFWNPCTSEHLGSLKRPQYLLQKREEFDARKVSGEELKAVEDRAISAIVQMQRGRRDQEYHGRRVQEVCAGVTITCV